MGLIPASLILFVIGVSIHNAVGVVRPRLSLQHFRQPLAFGVGVVPEIEKEEQENQPVQADDVDEDGELVGAVLHEEVLGDVAGHQNELDLGRDKERRGWSNKSLICTHLAQSHISLPDVPAGW